MSVLEFISAMENNDFKKVKKFLKNGWKPDVRQRFLDGKFPPVIFCCIHDFDQSLRVLLKHGADPNAGGNISALRTATVNSSIKCVRILLNHPKINVNKQKDSGMTALIVAAELNHETMAKMFLNHKEINVNLQCTDGKTALHYAVLKNHEDIVELFLESSKNFDLNIVDSIGRTAFDLIQTTEMSRSVEKLEAKRRKRIALEKKESQKKIDLANLEQEICMAEESLDSYYAKECSVQHEIKNVEIELRQLRVRAGEINQQIPELELKLERLNDKKDTILGRKGSVASEWMDCPICSEVMSSPRKIFQCHEGHCFCSVCRPQLKECPECRMDISNASRNRALEQIINEL